MPCNVGLTLRRCPLVVCNAGDLQGGITLWGLLLLSSPGAFSPVFHPELQALPFPYHGRLTKQIAHCGHCFSFQGRLTCDSLIASI